MQLKKTNITQKQTKKYKRMIAKQITCRSKAIKYRRKRKKTTT